MKHFLNILFSVSLFFAQQTLIKSGPMNGYSTGEEVLVWLQTKSSANVHLVYWLESAADKKMKSDVIKTEQDKVYTANIILRYLSPGQNYAYQIYSDNTVQNNGEVYHFVTQPRYFNWTQTPDFRIGLGSCFIVNDELLEPKEYQSGKNYEILDEIIKQKTDLFLWLGDNIYLRNNEWNSFSGMANRYTVNRSHPKLQNLLASTHNYATWDDHDYGPGDSDNSFHLKDVARNLFNLFWGNQSSGENGKGIYTKFTWLDAEFFLLDNRYFKDANNRKTGKKDYFGDKQFNWLINSLKSSNARFKFVVTGGQVVNPLKVYENFAIFEDERNRFLDIIDKEKINGIVFLTGDRHHSEISKMDRQNAYPLYDITISPLTAKVYPRDEYEKNPYRLQKDPTVTHNFGLIDVKTEDGKRVLYIKSIDFKGNLMFEHKIAANELVYK